MTSGHVFDGLVQGAPPRHTSYELPSYRYVPGSRPHPLADPRGHSFARPRRFSPAALDASRWWESSGYLHGCDLYNRGFWWEAHEAWEAIWHLAGRGSAERAALQGLIQLANCHLKLYMGRFNAVLRLRRSYGTHFDRAAGLAGPFFLGLDLSLLRAGADDYLTRVLGCPEPGHDPGYYPYLEPARDND